MAINYGLLTSGGTATGSPNVSGYTPAKLFDGYRHTQNDFGAATAYASSSGASSGNPITIVRDLGQNRVLNAINIFGLKDSPSYNTDPTTSETATNYTLGGFVLDYSTDGTNWTTLSTVTGNTKVRRDFTYSNFTARYVRLTVTSGAPNAGGVVYLVEFEIWGNPPADTTDPTGAITSTFSGAQFGIKTVNFNAADNSALASAQPKVNGINYGLPVTLSGISDSDSFSLDTSDFENGTYSLTVLIVDAAGNDYETNPVPITIENPSVLDEYFERFQLSEIFNITQLDLEMPVLRADFGDGYEAAALSGKPSGLRYWTISADVLPDLSQYSVDYVVDGDDETDSRFQYFWEFYRRHLSLGNKPFYFVDPRTNRKFLASFVDTRISFESITAKLYRGGVSIKQRRVKNSDLTYRTEDGSVSN